MLLIVGPLGLSACQGGRGPAPRPAPTTQQVAGEGARPAGSALATADATGPVQLFFTAELHNATAPCGCTSDPLGDVARIAKLVRAAGGRGLWLDGGGLLYDDPTPAAALHTQARLKAAFLARTFAELQGVGTLQPEDLSLGLVAGPERVVSNMELAQAAALGAVKPSALRTVGPLRVGVLGVVSQGLADGALRDARQALPPQIAALRQAGAQVVVALTGLPRPDARRLARQVPDVDVVLVGDQVEEGAPEAEQVLGADGQPGALLLMPAKQGQRVARLSLWRPEAMKPGRLRLVPGPALLQRLERQQAQAQAQVKDLEANLGTDASFLATSRAEVKRLGQELQAARSAQAEGVPPSGPYVTMELLAMNKAVARDPQVQAGMQRLDQDIGEENLKQVTGPPPPPLRGQPAYVGVNGCVGSCHWHDDAVKLWQESHHGGAWKTLVDAGKTLSLECVRCHATGFGELGGSNLRTLWQITEQRSAAQAGPAVQIGADLRDVGCEVCHGPGSLHASAKSPAKVPMPVPKPKADRCTDCHTREHSDTFDAKPYLRDILGKGHGEEARAALGPGPTGHELRQAALKRAGGH